MRFIHAADIHLDSPLTGLSAYPDAPAQMLRSATRDAFTKLVNEAIDLQVDFVVIAGDLYDGGWKDHNTGIFFCREMGRLKKAGIRAYVKFGNHDAESEMTKKLVLPDNVYTFESRKAHTFVIDGLKVALHGRSFKDAATTENLAQTYPDPLPGMFNIGVLHTALGVHSTHANYAPCTIDELHAKGYQYWALGHVHEYQVWQGASTIVFPGNLQGRHIRETGPRGAVLVTADETGVQKVERLFVDVLRWHAVNVDAAPCNSMAEVVHAINKELEAVLASTPSGMPSAVRITISGKTPVHGELFGMEAQLRAEVLASAAALGADRLWIEKVKTATTASDEPDAIRARGDALADLQAFFEDAQGDPEFLASLKTDLMALVAKAPLELQNAVPYFRDIRNGELAKLVGGVRPGLMSQLARME
ncbi:metallophosphoesterase family protein [Noviherbaspirillum denitrificans]|uniref:Metallophosphoesterase n=1 Tax=Noviherbaspirillum denitrificans TaxID=1968433 RepID=A0A254TKG5_9BURK|nr:DNA repair exonuclease [Noviherbaspirillum denitrificans]OWW20198.1 metallophosphoesterase [Noviherbaspirillum denitrificans]